MYPLVMLQLNLVQKKPYLIDSELNFDQHISSICSKASKKLHALGRIASFMSFNKHRTLMKAFIESQFNYCPLIWMFHSRVMNNKINRIHKRALRLVYSDHVSSSDKLLKKDRSFSIHHRKIQSPFLRTSLINDPLLDS